MGSQLVVSKIQGPHVPQLSVNQNYLIELICSLFFFVEYSFSAYFKIYFIHLIRLK